MARRYTERVYGSQGQKKERGVALILTLMFLLFLSILGGALLATISLDVRIGTNFQNNEQALYLAQAGLEGAREALRKSGPNLTAVLIQAAGPDRTLSTATDLSSLLDTDDLPLIPDQSAQRSSGAKLADTSGQIAGSCWVWIRNDVADGAAATTDSNQIVDLLSVGVVGNAQTTIEAVLRKGQFPLLPAALTLAGPVGVFSPSPSGTFRIVGVDAGTAGTNVDAVGTMSASDASTISASIAASLKTNYSGALPPTPDIHDESSLLDQSLRSVHGLEGLTSSILANATDVFNPAYGVAQSIGNFGSASDYRIGVVNGDCALGPGTGYGILVCRGEISVASSFVWNGVIVSIGQGVIRWAAAVSGTINGAVLLARTRAADRSPLNVLGSVLTASGTVTADLSAAIGPGIQYNTTSITSANQAFPFALLWFKQY